jgi:hypothetical protein
MPGDALSGADGTQPLPPARVFPDALSGLVSGGVRPVQPLVRVRTRPPEPVRPGRPGEWVRRAVVNHPSLQARPRSSVPAEYSVAEPTSTVPAPHLETTRRNRGSAVLGCLLALLLIFLTLGFSVIQGILERLGVLSP